jgi:iron complex outermembrane receptor protein
MTQSRKAWLLASAAIVSLSAAPAMAQDDEIVVTATKRAQTIQDVPFSVNAQTEDDIQRTGSQNLEDISRNVAGLIIQNLGPGQSQVAIRGVSAGQIVRDQPGVKEQVGVYLDESVVSLSLFTPDLELFDLNRVETLRGPQGTLFGSGSIGGTIRYITNQPVLGEYSGMAETGVNFVEDGGTGYSGKGVVNIPLGDTAAIRAVGYYSRLPGFIDALREDGSVTHDINDADKFGGRIALRFEPTPNIAITPRVVYQKIEADGFNRQEVFNLYANPFTTTRPPVTFGPRQQFLLRDEAYVDDFLMVDGTIEIGLGPVALTSVTSYIDREILVSRDASALTGSVSVDLGFPDAGVLLPSNLRDTTDLETFTQEVRLTSDYESRLQWLVGFFYSDVERIYEQRLPTPGYDAFTDLVLGAGTSDAVRNGFGPDSPFNSDLPYDIEQLAIFGEATLEFSDRTRFTAGLRYYDFEETRTITTGGLFANGDSGVVDETASDGFAPRFILSHDVSDGVTVNLQAAKGFRLGGVNDPLNVPICTPEDAAIFGGFQDYDDETLWNYEGGVKISKGNVTFNASGFYTDISGLQVTLDAGSCSSRITFNVPDAHTIGAEFELGAEIAPGLDLSVSGTVLEARFDSTVVDGSGSVLGGLRDGNRLASVPDFQIAATATYNFQFGGHDAFVSGSVQHVGDRITQPSDQEPGAGVFVSGLPFGGASGADATVLDLVLEPYQIVNINAGIDFGGVEVIAFINNATDENANLSFDRERGGRARLGFRTNQPRTFGVTARIRF